MHGVTINPIAFLVIQSNNVKLMPVNHSSSIDKLLDYIPDLLDKTNNMMNRIVNNKKEETEKILKEIKKDLGDNKQGVKRDLDKIQKQEEITYEYEYDESMDDE